jgi:hypothetical protein
MLGTATAVANQSGSEEYCDIEVQEQGVAFEGFSFVHTTIRVRIGNRVNGTFQGTTTYVDGIPSPHTLTSIITGQSTLTIVVGSEYYYSGTSHRVIGGRYGSSVCDDAINLLADARAHHNTGWTYFPLPTMAGSILHIANSNSVTYTLSQWSVSIPIPVGTNSTVAGWGIRLW